MKVKAEINGKVVDVEVPDDFTSDQIQKELDDLHQSTRPKSGGSQRASMATPTAGRGMFGDAVRERTLGFANSMGKGVPILGNLVNKYEDAANAPYSQDLERDYPLTATGGRILGGVLSTAPIAGGVAGSMREGSGVVRNALAQGGLFGGLGAADKIAEKGENADVVDVGTATILNALAGAAGPFIGKAFTPSTPRHVTHDELDRFITEAGRRAGTPPRLDPHAPFAGTSEEVAGRWGHLGGMLEDVESQIAGLPKHNPPTPEAVKKILDGVVGGGLGFVTDHLAGGMNPVLSTLVGGAVGNHIGPGIRTAVGNSALFNKWLNNTFTHKYPVDPILTSLGQGVLPSVVSSVPPPEQ